ncbi:MAG: hypothetical protein QG619_2382, partial [Pseudomonadota bacterium]|nr:hypothetical protein [Pseudomonadota bacterium]
MIGMGLQVDFQFFHRRLRSLCLLRALGVPTSAFADFSDDEIRVGLLVDMKSIYSHIS